MPPCSCTHSSAACTRCHCSRPARRPRRCPHLRRDERSCRRRSGRPPSPNRPRTTIRQPVLDRLVGADRATELLALLGIGQRGLKTPLRQPQLLGCQQRRTRLQCGGHGPTCRSDRVDDAAENRTFARVCSYPAPAAGDLHPERRGDVCIFPVRLGPRPAHQHVGLAGSRDAADCPVRPSASMFTPAIRSAGAVDSGTTNAAVDSPSASAVTVSVSACPRSATVASTALDKTAPVPRAADLLHHDGGLARTRAGAPE